MKIYVDLNTNQMGERAAQITAQELNRAIEQQGHARLLLSTGASQFEMLEALVKKNVRWDKVTMFHLDEYVDLPVQHPASFRKYLQERFVDKVHPGAYHFVNGEGDVKANIAALTNELRSAPIDVALIGIGENGHIAFNDPPADFENREAYIIVNLDERCKRQQMGEGWFATLDEVPNQAVTMTPWQIMQSRVILSVVPGKRKAEAIQKMLEAPATTVMVPATKLREHENCVLFLDEGSASEVDPKYLP
ncbi:glucosamine-6-phosphate deaminase [Oscillospiraceae bacterium LTW-04]|nr:glucosamine-6-phosphate deaminase [Oscillospiraceae bacterium MB24-C1]